MKVVKFSCQNKLVVFDKGCRYIPNIQPWDKVFTSIELAREKYPDLEIEYA